MRYAKAMVVALGLGRVPAIGHAQSTLSVSNLEAIVNTVSQSDPVASQNLSPVGLFYSAQNPNAPAVPANFNNLPAWDLGNGNYLLDDLDYGGKGQFNADIRPMDGGGGGSTNGFSYSFDTNGLWLEMTNITGGWAYANLHNATNQVYAILSSTNLPGNWSVETEVWSTNTSVMPFAAPVQDRTNSLYFLAEDWTGVTANGNTTPLWWLYYYFGGAGLNLSDTNLDSFGNDLIQDYQLSLDPNVINFSINVTNPYYNTASVSIPINVAAGIPFFMAIMVDDTNSADAIWTPFNSNVVANVGSLQGWHRFTVGLRGLPSNATPSWRTATLDVLTIPPVLVVTNPTTTTVMQPMIEIQGYCNEQLASLTYNLSNAAGVLTNLTAFILSQSVDTNMMKLTTNTFQAFDVPLTNGNNLLTFYAADRAGNVTVTNLTFTVDYSGKTNPPIMQVYWPQNGDAVSGTAISLRGSLDDFTASITAQIVDTNGDTNFMQGLVERNGSYWIENTPLAPGTNYITITAMDAVGNQSTTNYTVVNNSAALTINNFSSQLGGSPRNVIPSVSGSIQLTNCTLWVNGIQAAQNGDGAWQASSVPLGSGGTAVVEARAIPNTPSDNNGNGAGMTGATSDTPGNPTAPDSVAAELEMDQPAVVYMQSFSYNHTYKYNENVCTAETSTQGFETGVSASYGNGGTAYANSAGTTTIGTNVNTWSETQNFNWPCDQCAVTDIETNQNGNTNSVQTSISGMLATCMPYSFFSASMAAAEWDIDGEVGFTTIADGCTIAQTDSGNESICTSMTLFTGGKGIPSEQIVFGINATASSYAPADDTSTNYDTWGPVWGPGMDIFPVPPSDTTVLGKSPGNDGILWKALPPGATMDATVQALVTRYSYTVGATSYPIDIMASVGGANYDITTTAAQICVGQKVSFTLSSSPPYTLAQIYWDLPGDFVNTPQPVLGSFDYIEDASLLLNISPPDTVGTTCWYINGRDGTIYAPTSYSFANGQTVSIQPQGTINVYRPSIVNFIPSNPTPSIDITNGEIRLDNLAYSVGIDSQYPGNGDYTQIVSITAANGTFGSTTRNTNLDNFPFYVAKSFNPPGSFNIYTPNLTSYWQFSDQPGSTLSAPTTSVTFQMEDYVMFRPASGSGNIYVTLGTVSWDWTGSTTYNSTTGTWSAPSQVGVHPPMGNDTSDAFPMWTQVYP